MRQEVMGKIVTYLAGKGIKTEGIKDEITMILSDYEIQKRETSLAIRGTDRNKEVFQKFLISKTVKGCTQRTIELYQKEIWKILCKINKPIDEITADDIRLYLAIRQRKDGVTKTTAGNELRYLRSFFNYLHAEEIITRNPLLKVETIRKEKTKKNAFTEMEVERIRDACKNEWEVAVIEVLLSTGCRVSELVNIKIEDIKGDQLNVIGKGEKERTVYLNARAVVAVEKYLQKRKDTNPYLFPGGYFASPDKKPGIWYEFPERIKVDEHCDKGAIEAKVRKIGKRTGIKEVHPHKFRRTCATFALRRGMPIEQVSKMLGHEQINTTQIYLDLSEEDLRLAHKKYVI